MQFEFATAARILFGPGVRHQVPKLAAAWASRVLLVTGRDALRAAPLRQALVAQGLEVSHYAVTDEPTIDTIDVGVRQARREGCQLVIGLGGGSVVDAGKAIATMLTNEGELLDYLEVIGRGQPITQMPAPYIAIPTTAGTGAEVTRNAVIGSTQHAVKVSLRSPLMLPRLAVVDPELTYGLPPAVTAATGLDALTQVLEPFVSHQSNPLTDTLCREGLRRAARSLQRAYEHGDDAEAREDMALVSLLGGLALANAKLGAVHGIAGPLGGMFPAPHGATCAALLPHVMAANVQALSQRDPTNPALQRYDEVAQLLTGEPAARAVEGIAWVRRLVQSLPVPGLGTYGLSAAALPDLIQKATRASSMKGNPIELTESELRQILQHAL